MSSRLSSKVILGDYCRSLLPAFFATYSLASALICGPAIAQQHLAERIAEARNRFRPVTEQQLSALLTELTQRMAEVERYVQPSSPNGQQWLRYLAWDGLQRELAARDSRAFEPLDESMRLTLARLDRNLASLDRPHFRRLARALRRYRDTRAVASSENPADVYNRLLDALPTRIESYRREPSRVNADALVQIIQYVDAVGLAPHVIEGVRNQVSRSNAFVEVTTNFIAAAADPIDRSEPVTDCILGTRVHSSTHTTGTVTVRSIPSADRALLELVTHGHTRSRSVGYHSPAVIRSTSDTSFSATKRIELSDASFSAQGAFANATTDTHLQSVAKQGGGLGSRLVARGGWKRARQSEGRAEAIAADHAEDRIERHFNEDADRQLADARARYESDFRQPLERRNALPDRINFSSTSDSVSIELRQASRTQLAALGPPPPLSRGHDVTMRLHESAFNNYAYAMLAGAVATQPSVDQDVKFDVDLPKWMKRMWENRKTVPTDAPAANPKDFKPFAMTLREDQPVSARFLDGNQVELTLRIAELKSGNKKYEDWAVTGAYVGKVVDDRLQLDRVGGLRVDPIDRDPDNAEIGVKKNLEVEFEERSAQGKGFPKTIEIDPPKPEGDLAKAGPLGYRDFTTTRDGWATVGLDRSSRSDLATASETVIETSWNR